ncbi:Arylsulfatase [Pontiella desulfatans]|uniref:Arylsulfatase n=1 Tax=Pontiella desulfatans TaxID=2750659 RepID=A0A6C2U6T9_PONDE|nr:sulfatase [Pontiella desulfatans]SPS74001.1 sulfatase S1_16 [Kiritimatiellales bacterium]VGO15740.1 Arylsulfatase [Pontiella desulfatans]
MKTHKKSTLLVAAASLLLGSVAAANSKPNIVFILVDDMPWYGTATMQEEGFGGSAMKWRNTPNIDTIGKEGMVFANAYSAAGMCGPSRCSIQVGMTAARTRYSGNGNFGDDCTFEVSYIEKVKGAPFLEPEPMGSIHPDFKTMGDVLREQGYATAHFGKWHAYGGGPEARGYDESDGETSNAEGGPQLCTDPKDPKRIFSMTRSSINFIERQVASDKPFFVQISHYAEHNQQMSLPETLKKYTGNPEIKAMEKSVAREVATHAAAVEDMDTSIGMVMKKLDELGISDNTYVVFTSDNGKGLYNGKDRILRGEKWWLWEGGIRVPMSMKGPGISAGSRSCLNVVGYDFLPTFYDIAGGDVARLENVDGVSIMPIAKGGNVKGFKDRALFFHYPHHRNTTQHSVIIKDHYKLFNFYELPEPYLYDLKKDIGEVSNIAGQMPEKVQQMKSEMDAYHKRIDALLPKPNPNASENYVRFDPAVKVPPVCDLVDGKLPKLDKSKGQAPEENQSQEKMSKEEKKKAREERRKNKKAGV